MTYPVPEHILSISTYKPGKPIQELERELGISGVIKLASNENPLGPSPRAMQAIADHIGSLHRYPDGSGFYLTRALSEWLHVPEASIVLGNGSDDIIGLLTRAFLLPGDTAVMTDPSFLMYEITVKAAGAEPVMVPLDGVNVDLDAIGEAIRPSTRMVFLTHPNNPTGKAIPRAELDRFLDKLPRNILLVMDEAYVEFIRTPGCGSTLDLVGSGRPVVVLRTFSKAYGLAGIRVGYGVMDPEIAGVLQRIRQPFNVNSLALVAAEAALKDTAFLEKTVSVVHAGLDYFYQSAEAMGLPYYKSDANFCMIRVNRPSVEVFEAMLKAGVIIRSMHAYGFPDCIRVNAGLETENSRFIATLKTVLAS
ncbi:MAG: histidinol-phosphate transaminase [Deltaproteobacteria bacterium]|nr:MAG: histidinol-phosphate transaminase [Deltaproteobacteria bacterium]